MVCVCCGLFHQVPDRFLEVAQVTLREFFNAIVAGKDADPSWKKAIYKVICKLDSEVPDVFKSPNCLQELLHDWLARGGRRSNSRSSKRRRRWAQLKPPRSSRPCRQWIKMWKDKIQLAKLLQEWQVPKSGGKGLLVLVCTVFQTKKKIVFWERLKNDIFMPNCSASDTQTYSESRKKIRK